MENNSLMLSMMRERWKNRKNSRNEVFPNCLD